MLVVLAACTPPAVPTPGAAVPTVPATSAATATLAPTLTPSPTPTVTLTPTPTQTPTLAPEAWKSMPVIPTLSPFARAVYEYGLSLGNNPRAFSKIGDCESRTTWYLADFDLGAAYYNLGPYPELQTVIDYYAGSFGRLSEAAKPGFTAASLMTPLWADPGVCLPNEASLACELRLHRPAFALITLGTNDAVDPKNFEPNMRRLIETTLMQGVVPVLATKADNIEGDNSINATIARLAYEYDIPLWNLWAALQPLPHHGLQDDGVHLTFASSQFDDPLVMQSAWPVRNLTALQTLYALWEGTAR